MEEKLNISGMQSAETGVIYEFLEADGTIKNMVLVVQNPKRCEENLVSILMVGTKKGGNDSVPVRLYDTNYYVHCGMITYCRRERLGKRIDVVSDDTLRRIRNGIMWELGFTDTNIDYKKLYDDLLEKIAVK